MGSRGIGGPSSSEVRLCHGKYTRHVPASRSRRQEVTKIGQERSRLWIERRGSEREEKKEQEQEESEGGCKEEEGDDEDEDVQEQLCASWRFALSGCRSPSMGGDERRAAVQKRNCKRPLKEQNPVGPPSNFSSLVR
eukprot:765630-Hanusia_phi.AAC.2